MAQPSKKAWLRGVGATMRNHRETIGNQGRNHAQPFDGCGHLALSRATIFLRADKARNWLRCRKVVARLRSALGEALRRRKSVRNSDFDEVTLFLDLSSRAPVGHGKNGEKRFGFSAGSLFRRCYFAPISALSASAKADTSPLVALKT